jgi:hypothetical protein
VRGAGPSFTFSPDARSIIRRGYFPVAFLLLLLPPFVAVVATIFPFPRPTVGAAVGAAVAVAPAPPFAFTPPFGAAAGGGSAIAAVLPAAFVLVAAMSLGSSLPGSVPPGAGRCCNRV